MGFPEMLKQPKWGANFFSADFLKKLYALSSLSFSFLWWASDGSTGLMQKFLIVSFAFIVIYDRRLRQDPLILGVMLLIAFFSLEFIWHSLTISEAIFGNHFPSKYLNFFCFFLLIAYGTVVWKRVSPFLILIGAAAGLIVFLGLYSSIAEWRLSWQGARTEFGFRNAQHAGIFFGTGLLGIAFFGHRIIRASSEHPKILSVLITSAFAALMLYGTIVTQTRAVWIALMLAFLTGGAAYIYTVKIEFLIAWFRNLRHVVLTVLLVSSLIAIGFALGLQGRIQQRIEQENISMHTIQAATHFEGQKLTSSGIRIALWTASIGWIEERPLLGWGSLTVRRLIRSDSRFDPEFKHEFGHLHNSVLELLVAVGAIGLFSIGVLVMILAAKVLKARASGTIPKDVFLFAWAFLVFWIIVNCFESYVNYATGFYIHSIVAGFLYAFCIQQPPASQGDKASHE